jgi:hypothetical protein
MEWKIQGKRTHIVKSYNNQSLQIFHGQTIHRVQDDDAPRSLGFGFNISSRETMSLGSSESDSCHNHGMDNHNEERPLIWIKHSTSEAGLVKNRDPGLNLVEVCVHGIFE